MVFWLLAHSKDRKITTRVLSNTVRWFVDQRLRFLEMCEHNFMTPDFFHFEVMTLRATVARMSKQVCTTVEGVGGWVGE